MGRATPLGLASLRYSRFVESLSCATGEKVPGSRKDYGFNARRQFSIFNFHFAIFNNFDAPIPSGPDVLQIEN